MKKPSFLMVLIGIGEIAYRRLDGLPNKRFRQADVFQRPGAGEERRDLVVAEAGDAAADAGDIEEQFRMRLGESDEFVHIGLDGLHAALHRRNGIALALQPDSLPHHGAELPPGHIGGPAAVPAGQIAAEDENLVRPEFRNEIRRKLRPRDVVVCSHNDCGFIPIIGTVPKKEHYPNTSE